MPANCLCRHGEHEGIPCYWESPGGGLVGQACDCETYQPCPHPRDKRGPNNHSGNPTCGQCAQHFESEEAYLAVQGLPTAVDLRDHVLLAPGSESSLERDKAIWAAGGVSGTAEAVAAAVEMQEHLVSFPAKIPERTRLKMRIAQNVRDLDEQGLQNVLAAIATERSRMKPT
jgi:hypothetical protein